MYIPISLTLLALLFLLSVPLLLNYLHHKPPKPPRKAQRKPPLQSQIHADKALYQTLQNPGPLSPNAITQTRTRLISLLDQALARSAGDPHSILALDAFNAETLRAFLRSRSQCVRTAWIAYVQRRQAGGDRELFLTREHAESWLESAAPVKLIDGAWLVGLHGRETAGRLRPVTRIAWQILSEECGDGDLRKNHVYVYSQLLASFGSCLPRADAVGFVRAEMNPNEDTEVWAAGVAQLALGRLGGEFLPEVLGFNLAFEMVALDTLLAGHELKELGLDPSYFNLHVTIDNADSGHTAMALECVLKLLEVGGPELRQRNWRGIQAGFLLATTLRSTPAVPSSLDRQVLDMFTRKLEAGNASHQSCRAVIGGSSIVFWMQSEEWEKRKYRFLQALAKSSWIIPGDPDGSRFYAELGWKGRMFGAFTMQERRYIADWICSLKPLDQNIQPHISWGRFRGWPLEGDTGIQVATSTNVAETKPPSMTPFGSVILDGPVSHVGLSTLLLYSLIPFERALVCPSRAASYRIMRLLRIQRLLHGFTAEVPNGVDGMDQVNRPSQRSIFDFAARLQPGDARCQSSSQSSTEWTWLETAAQDVEGNFWLLLGCQYCLVLNVLTNRCLLRGSGVDEDLIVELEVLGSKILQQLSDLHLEKEPQCQIGYSFAAHRLRAVSES